MASAAPAKEVVGSVTEIGGVAQLQRDGNNLSVELTMAVQVNDKLQTTRDAHLTITLNGVNQLRLAGSSAIVFRTRDGGDRFVVDLLVGGLISTVRSGTSPARAGYEVRTPNAVVAVNVAEFETVYIAGKSCPDAPPCLRYTDVGVYKGLAQVSNPTNPQNPSVQVEQGLETAVPCEQPPTEPAPFGMRQLGMPQYH